MKITKDDQTFKSQRNRRQTRIKNRLADQLMIERMLGYKSPSVWNWVKSGDGEVQ